MSKTSEELIDEIAPILEGADWVEVMNALSELLIGGVDDDDELEYVADLLNELIEDVFSEPEVSIH
jgi:hypothetical protein